MQGGRKFLPKTDKVAVFIFGHTHAAFLRRDGDSGRIVLNTGTWLKLLHRVPARIGLLPAVYYPSYRLNYFRIEKETGRMVIHYVQVPKKAERELTWLQWLVTLGKKPNAPNPSPQGPLSICNALLGDRAYKTQCPYDHRTAPHRLTQFGFCGAVRLGFDPSGNGGNYRTGLHT